MTARLQLDADYLSLRAIGPWLAGVAGPAAELGAVELAVHELGANCIDHAQPVDGKITLDGTMDGDVLIIHVRDRGKEFDRSGVKSPDPDVPQVRGYGLMILEQIAEDVQYNRTDDTNVWVLRFRVVNDQIATHAGQEAGR